MNRDLRHRCETIVRTLDQRIGGIRVPFDLNALLDQLEADRGRPIELVPFSATAPGEPCGIWVGTDRLDLIYYEEATSPLHQDHIILHEVGHMVCDHTGAACPTPITSVACSPACCAPTRCETRWAPSSGAAPTLRWKNKKPS
jgi:hypothetical protein